MLPSQPFDESKVLIIYTGGTIGMLVGHQGYVPEPYFLTETLLNQHRFHDPYEESLFSHSASVEGFREWSNSGRSSPAPSPRESTFGSRPATPGRPQGPHQPSTLLVRSSRPIGTPVPLNASGKSSNSPLRHPQCRKVSEDVYEAHLPSLVTPRTTTNGSSSKRIRYVILEVCLSHLRGKHRLTRGQWNPLLDSSNMEIAGTVSPVNIFSVDTNTGRNRLGSHCDRDRAQLSNI